MHNKIIIITGKKGPTGKSFLAKTLALSYNHPAFYGRVKSIKQISKPFFFSILEKETDLIVFDDVPGYLVGSLVYYFGSDPITVNRKYQEPFEIERPNIIITTTGFYHKNLDNSFKRRIEVIDTESFLIESRQQRFFSFKKFDMDKFPAA